MRGTKYLELLASPVLDEPRFDGKPEYSSHLVVHKDAVFSDMDSLRGARIAFNDAMSLSGYHICLIWLTEHGRSPDMFSEWLPSGGHELSAELVASGRADVAAIDVGVWMRLERDRPELLSELRILGGDCVLPTVPIQPFVSAGRLPDAMKTKLRQALLSLATPTLADRRVSVDADDVCCAEESKEVHASAGDDTAALRTLFLTGFVAVNDASFDRLRALLSQTSATTPHLVGGVGSGAYDTAPAGVARSG